jgi:cell division FtsZ-interacting protein ZapD
VQLLRVVVPSSLGIYSEISGSHYRSSVRFVQWPGAEERPRQAQQDMPFEIICCE